MGRCAGMLLVCSMVLVACGADDPVDDPADDAAQDAVDTLEETTEDAEEALEELGDDPEEFAEDLADDLEAQQEAVGGGGAELTVDGETWTFDSVLCAFGPEEIGDEDAEFVLSAIGDGLQLYVSIDGFGHSVTLDDIENFEDPSVGWAAGGPFGALTGEAEEFVEVDGKQVRAEAEFVDARDEMSMTTAPGVLEATCP
jgi:hypothetical protein